MLKDDLKIAKIQYETDDGVADFHALRHTFGTLLAQSGVLPQEAQRLMRHSDINPTMGIYIHLRLLDKARAIGKLPTLSESAQQIRTGTDDLTENPIKGQQNSAKSMKCEVRRKEDGRNVNPFECKDLQ